MKLIDALAAFHNWLSDKDFIWWPFSFLKPLKREEMTFKRTGQMTACFGGLTFGIFTVYAIANNAFTINSALMTLVTSLLSFFLWFNLVTRPLWNRRARKHQ
jgi:hypothetical protein